MFKISITLRTGEKNVNEIEQIASVSATDLYVSYISNGFLFYGVGARSGFKKFSYIFVFQANILYIYLFIGSHFAAAKFLRTKKNIRNPSYRRGRP